MLLTNFKICSTQDQVDAVDQYKKTVAATYFNEPTEETPDETDNGND